MRLAYVNGRYVPRHDAAVSIEDRGYQFADGVYEVLWLHHGTLIDETPHLARLKRSLAAIKIKTPMTDAALQTIIRELIRRNHAAVGDYMLYLQITRGTARRNHLFPKPAMRPSVVMTLTKISIPTEADIAKGVKAISHPDLRWARKDIKSIALLPNILARQNASESGAREAVLIDSARGVITEGSTTNIFMVKKNIIITHPADTHILNGITRMAILKLARKLKIKIEERPFTLKEALAADELFITSTTASLLPISQLDNKKIPVGAVSKRLYTAYQNEVRKKC